MNTPLLRVRDLVVRFPVAHMRPKAWVHAVEGVSFDIDAGTTLGLVGESGSGKSTVGNAIMGLVPTHAGSVSFEGREVAGASGSDLRDIRRAVTMVFQDPLAALDPRRTVAESIAEPLEIHRIGGGAARRTRTAEVMDLVGLPDRFAGRYPHELSGGQRQRVCIARALAASPRLIIFDEATASLDVSVGAQIMNLLRALQDELGLAYLFISHDLAAVDYMSHDVLVMYLGHMMELSPRDRLHADPAHPYTQALTSAIPLENPVAERARQRIILQGDVPSPVFPPSGCVFRTRCPLAIAECAEEVPDPREMSEGHQAWCLRAGEKVRATVRPHPVP